MAAKSNKPIVVIDGSNLATEGRSEPSLSQLRDMLRAYKKESPNTNLVVVVDATFEHRIPEKERSQCESMIRSGDLITPPAGTVGRGDAFILAIASKSGASVLSNDSFQEFHDKHDWLFNPGRLIGGKPVPSVGWVFVSRSPVRQNKLRSSLKTAPPTAKRPSKPAPPDTHETPPTRARRSRGKRGPRVNP